MQVMGSNPRVGLGAIDEVVSTVALHEGDPGSSPRHNTNSKYNGVPLQFEPCLK